MAERIELIEGLKQAVERGESLDEAKKSFINAGYPVEDVEDSAKKVMQGGLPLVSPPLSKPTTQNLITPSPSQPQLNNVLTPKPLPLTLPPQTQKKKNKMNALIFILIFILLILIGMIFFFFFAKEKAIIILKNLLK